MPTYKHKKASTFPKISSQDPELQEFAEEVGKLITESFRNMYDDIHQMAYAEITTAVPTATDTYWGKLYVYNDGTSSAADILYCLMDTGSGGRGWKTVTTS